MLKEPAATVGKLVVEQINPTHSSATIISGSPGIACRTGPRIIVVADRLYHENESVVAALAGKHERDLRLPPLQTQ
jgi:hypothetical protein